MNIDLTEKEKQIFDLLFEVRNHFNLQTRIRVAGGWVRDKLLGEKSNDIDIALDDMMGKEFCDMVEQYSSSIGKKTTIKSNPEKSKHLETARMVLLDLWIDFVNLRAEDYCQESRIPKMRFGTAEEDAYRRDLTINSLFYNINTSSLEDFTQRGIADLRSGKIVTPLPPKRTFLDDPLRVLRAIRFGTRFGFVLDEELKIAAAHEDVKAAIANKITRQRIGHEIDLMISGKEPVKAMTYISELRLFWAVFSLPLVVEPSAREGDSRLCVTFIDSAWRLLQLVGSSSFNDNQQRLCLYAALLLPLRKTVCKDKKGKKIPVASHILSTSLVLKSSDAETVERLHLATEKFVSLIPSIISDEDLQTLKFDVAAETNDNVQHTSKLRVVSGLLLREIKEFWRVSLLLALLIYPGEIASSTDIDMELNKRRTLYDRVEEAILGMGLENVWKLERLVNGKEIMNILQITSGGPIVKEWIQKMLEWQLEHPSGSAEEWIEYMKSKHARTE